MSENESLTAEEFAAKRPDLPEAGRWLELVAGRVVVFDPPDDVHGNVVLHLTKTLGEHLQQPDSEDNGYLCFELGLLVRRNPDTIHFPAVSYITAGMRFAENDQTYTTSPPRLVVDIASTNRRRRGLSERVTAYQEWGVETVWIADAVEHQMHVVQRGRGTKTYAAHESLPGGSVFSGFRTPVAGLFQAPDWWT